MKYDSYDGGKSQAAVLDWNACTVTAYAIAASLPWDYAHVVLAKLGRKKGKGLKSKKLMRFLKWKQVRRSGTVAKFVKDFPVGSFYVRSRSGGSSYHAFAVVDGVVYDSGKLIKPRTRILGAWRKP
jgi:hypothetical protein